MTQQSIKLHREHQARAACALVIRQLRVEIASGPRRVIDALIVAAETIVEITGGNHLTTALRAEIAECHRMLAVREGQALAKARRAKLRIVNSKGGEA